MVGGVQQCWIMLGIGRRWERLSLTSCPCLLQRWRTKVFLREFFFHPSLFQDEAESGWKLPSSSKSPLQFVGLKRLDQNGFHWSPSFQLSMALCSVSTLWCHGVLHGVFHGLDDERQGNREGWSWSHVLDGCPMACCGVRSLHALHWCGQVR